MTDLSQSRKGQNQSGGFYTSAGLILLFSLMTIFFAIFLPSGLGAPGLGVENLRLVLSAGGDAVYRLRRLHCLLALRLSEARAGAVKARVQPAELGGDAVRRRHRHRPDVLLSRRAGDAICSRRKAGQTIEAARQAMVWTLFHYGLTGWSMYALMGMALGYFSYRYNLPLTIRSALYPIFGKRINGPIGHSVDIAAVIGTIFGIATTLGIGVVQLNYGLSVLFDIPDSLAAKAALIALSVIIATISVTSGVDKGIRVLSELNVALALGLILFVLFMGDTSFLLNALVLNVGDYVNRFMGMTLNSFAFDRPVEWMNNWTLFFWAWWVAWSPFVGLFLARISRGRTIRQFVMGTLIIPFTFTLLWLSVFGNSALYEIIHGDAAFAQEAMAHPERGYSLLAQYPAFTFSASVATITGLLFYVTSADSGALVLGISPRS